MNKLICEKCHKEVMSTRSGICGDCHRGYTIEDVVLYTQKLYRRLSKAEDRGTGARLNSAEVHRIRRIMSDAGHREDFSVNGEGDDT